MIVEMVECDHWKTICWLTFHNQVMADGTRDQRYNNKVDEMKN